MKFSYRLKRICGSVYSNGDVAFTPDGNSVVSPIGNRLNVYDLINQSTDTLQLENRKNIVHTCISHNGRFLISIDSDGNALFFNFPRRVLLHKFNFRQRVFDIKFSPDDTHFAVTFGRGCQIWRTPSAVKEFAPLTLVRTFMGHYDESNCLDWSPDSQSVIIGSKDLTARIYANVHKKVTLSVLSGHRDEIVGAYFGKEGNDAFTIAGDGGVFSWHYDKIELNNTSSKMEQSDSEDSDSELDSDDNDDPEESARQDFDGTRAKKGQIVRKFAQRNGAWQLTERQLLRDHEGSVVSTSFCSSANLLALGFATGVFGLYEMPGCMNLQRLSVSNSMISTISLNQTGEWVALGIAEKGQLLVWEWKSESYVLKQQGHLYGLNVLDFSPEGQYIATGGEDGRVKIWNALSGFCVITFKEHIAPVTGVKFIGHGQGKAVLSSSLDGTVRAHDLVRYKNFKTLTAPTPVQFTCVAADPSGEVVCAGTLDPFNIYVWSLQTGKLLEILAGHEGPIACMTFSAHTSLLATGSWDGTLKLWDVYKNTCVETFEHGCDVMAVAFRPDGKEVACSATNGNIYFWDVDRGEQIGTIEGRSDISGGRLTTEQTTAANSSRSKFFTALDYSADGSCILAGGRSKYICIYSIVSGVLIKKFQLSHNRSLEGVVDHLRSDRVVDGVILDNLEAPQEEDNAQLGRFENSYKRFGKNLPGGGKSKLNDGSRTINPELMTAALQFSPTGREWAAASTQGLQIFGLDETLLFAPIELDESITPQSISLAVANCDYTRALSMALMLNDEKYIALVMDSIPMSSIDLIAQSLNPNLLKGVMKYLADALSSSNRFEFYLSWVLAIMQLHGSFLQLAKNNLSLTEALRALLRVLQQHEKDVLKMTEDNLFLVQFIIAQLRPEQDLLKESEETSMIQDEQEEEARVVSTGDDEDEEIDVRNQLILDEDEEEEEIEGHHDGLLATLSSAWQDDDDDDEALAKLSSDVHEEEQEPKNSKSNGKKSTQLKKGLGSAGNSKEATKSSNSEATSKAKRSRK
jgi:periodic tryptophan protein 2